MTSTLNTDTRPATTGRADAELLLARMETGEMPFLLGYAVKEMIAKGSFGAYEVDFCHAVAARLSAA